MKNLLLLAAFLLMASCAKELDTTQVSLEAAQPAIPVLAGKEQNRVLEFQLNVLDSASTYVLKTITLNFEGTTEISDISKTSVLSNNEDNYDKATAFGSTDNVTSKIAISGNQTLSNGTNFLWLTVKLNGTPKLSNKVAAKITSIEFTDGSILKPSNPDEIRPQRIGIALLQHDQNDVDTYRIPGLATTNKGTLIAVYDNRYNGRVDLQADVDVGMSRSMDGGRSWEPMKVIMDMGEYGGLPQNQNGIGDPSVLVDRITGTIWVAAVWAHGHPEERNWLASKPGMSPVDTSQFVLVKSEDDGVTWSDPINITSQIKSPEWHLLLQGPGKGITLKDGTLVFPAQFKDKEEMPHSTIIYSKDQGKTWKIGSGAKPDTTESQIVELEDGSLMLNMRDNRNRNSSDGQHGRSVAITTDLGKTWTEHPTSRKALKESACMASLIAFENQDKEQVLFFSNPNTTEGRTNMTIKTSFDQGMTWPKDNQLELYEYDGYGYSCMTVIDAEHIGILYEGTKELYFEKIAISELLGVK